VKAWRSKRRPLARSVSPALSSAFLGQAHGKRRLGGDAAGDLHGALDGVRAG
jgi:hypothetical protein